MSTCLWAKMLLRIHLWPLNNLLYWKEFNLYLTFDTHIKAQINQKRTSKTRNFKGITIVNNNIKLNIMKVVWLWCFAFNNVEYYHIEYWCLRYIGKICVMYVSLMVAVSFIFLQECGWLYLYNLKQGR